MQTEVVFRSMLLAVECRAFQPRPLLVEERGRACSGPTDWLNSYVDNAAWRYELALRLHVIGGQWLMLDPCSHSARTFIRDREATVADVRFAALPSCGCLVLADRR